RSLHGDRQAERRLREQGPGALAEPVRERAPADRGAEGPGGGARGGRAAGLDRRLLLRREARQHHRGAAGQGRAQPGRPHRDRGGARPRRAGDHRRAREGAGRDEGRDQDGREPGLMNPSRIFILRPVATSLLMIGLLLLGLVAYTQLPVSALPQVDYPTMQVSTFYPGASPEVMSSSVTAPLERQFGQVPGLSQMTSTSSLGSSIITLQFNLDQDIDVAEQQVQAAIN